MKRREVLKIAPIAVIGIAAGGRGLGRAALSPEPVAAAGGVGRAEVGPLNGSPALFLDGKPVEPDSRHTRLYEKYRQRLSEVRDGTAVLGIEPAPAPAAPGPASGPAAQH